MSQQEGAGVERVQDDQVIGLATEERHHFLVGQDEVALVCEVTHEVQEVTEIVPERQRERGKGREGGRETERERVCEGERVCVRERERVCVCVCERERVGE